MNLLAGIQSVPQKSCQTEYVVTIHAESCFMCSFAINLKSRI